MAMFRDAIETFMPKKVEQELNKVELVPLDVEQVIKELTPYLYVT